MRVLYETNTGRLIEAQAHAPEGALLANWANNGGDAASVVEAWDDAFAPEKYQSLEQRLETARGRALAEIESRAEALRAAVASPLPGQLVCYLLKEQQAREFLAATDPDPADFGYLAADAELTGGSLLEAAQAIVASADAWKAWGEAVERSRRTLKARIEAAASVGDVEAVDIAAGWPN